MQKWKLASSSLSPLRRSPASGDLPTVPPAVLRRKPRRRRERMAVSMKSGDFPAKPVYSGLVSNFPAYRQKMCTRHPSRGHLPLSLVGAALFASGVLPAVSSAIPSAVGLSKEEAAAATEEASERRLGATAVRAACSGATSVVGRCIAGSSARFTRGDGAARRPCHRQKLRTGPGGSP
jgi:hypothetical protein